MAMFIQCDHFDESCWGNNKYSIITVSLPEGRDRVLEPHREMNKSENLEYHRLPCWHSTNIQNGNGPKHKFRASEWADVRLFCENNVLVEYGEKLFLAYRIGESLDLPVHGKPYLSPQRSEFLECLPTQYTGEEFRLSPQCMDDFRFSDVT